MKEPESVRPSIWSLSRMVGRARRPGSISELREMTDAFMPVLNADPPQVGRTWRGVLVREVAGTCVTADVVQPPGPDPHPTLLYLHGGGFVAGSATSHHKIACRFAERGFLVMTLDYRLAPRSPFPAAFEDCVYAADWLADNAVRFGGDSARLAIGGDSAGANLAAAAAIALAERPREPRVAAAVLFYGLFDIAALRSDPLEGSDDPLINREVVQMLIEAYLGPDPSRGLLNDPRVSPSHAAERLPPSFVAVGTEDPILGQSRQLVEMLRWAGTPHELVLADGMPHGFVQVEFFPQALQTIDAASAFLHRHLDAQKYRTPNA